MQSCLYIHDAESDDPNGINNLGYRTANSNTERAALLVLWLSLRIAYCINVRALAGIMFDRILCAVACSYFIAVWQGPVFDQLLILKYDQSPLKQHQFLPRSSW